MRPVVECSDLSPFRGLQKERCEHMVESKKATESVAREKTHIRGTRAVSQLVFLMHVGALVSALPSSAPRKSDV